MSAEGFSGKTSIAHLADTGRGEDGVLKWSTEDVSISENEKTVSQSWEHGEGILKQNSEFPSRDINRIGEIGEAQYGEWWPLSISWVKEVVDSLGRYNNPDGLRLCVLYK